MKSILMSIRPRHVANILSRFKTIEIRKRFPKDYRGWVYVYCTKDKSNKLHKNRNGWFVNEMNVIFVNGNPIYDNYNGKVVARFYCDDVKECKVIHDSKYDDMIIPQYCLTHKELENYVGNKTYFELHISQLEIFDTPKELSEFQGTCNNSCELKRLKLCKHIPNCNRPLKKAPQSWCYIESED